jgi:hypothetical protein
LGKTFGPKTQFQNKTAKILNSSKKIISFDEQLSNLSSIGSKIPSSVLYKGGFLVFDFVFAE